MTIKLLKPFTEKERLDFIVSQNHNKGLIIQESETALYALEPWEELKDDKIINHKKKYEKEQKALEEERVNNLTMKSYDFIKTLNSFGVEYNSISEYLAQHPELDLKLKYSETVQLKDIIPLCPITIENTEIALSAIQKAFKEYNAI